MINYAQKNIYNSFLKISRIIKNKPFKFRNNFDNIDATTLLTLRKLEQLFKRHHTIAIDDFFTAPYRVYNDQDYFDLQFYTTQKAIKCYTRYVQDRELNEADSDDTITLSKQCCIFIYVYCKQNNMSLQEYKTKKDGNIPLALMHLKEHKINYYTLHALDIPSLIESDMKSIYSFMFDNFYNTFKVTREKFIKSTRLKTTLRTALTLIEQKLNDQKKD